jgi:hypothetical protein
MPTDIRSQDNGHGIGAALRGPSVDEAEQMAEQARVALERAQEQVATFIRERPLVCLAGALALGYVVGRIVSR